MRSLLESGLRRSFLAVVLPLALATCGGGGGPPGDSAAPESGAPDHVVPSETQSASPEVEAAGQEAGGGWENVEALLAAKAAAAGVDRLGLAVWDGTDRRVYQHMIGDFSPDTPVAVASASKLVSGLVIFDVIRRGALTLDSTTGDVLGWTGASANITLRELLSFTSGLPREAACALNPLTSLAACVESIAGLEPLAPPATRFDYGSTHLHVAARMAEVATGVTWAALFEQTLRIPLGLPDDVAYYTAPRQALGKINPLVAGGLRASMNAYVGFLALAYHKGSYGGLTVGTPVLFDDQAKEPYPDVLVGFTPAAQFRYGLASWLLCDTPATGCAALASPGAFGFTPWYDRDTGYYAILGMELARDGADDQVAPFAIDLMQSLAPLIRQRVGQ